MVDRIQKIIQIKKLTSSKFADKIGVPRSTISHILSGRNNPSLELLLKILDAFPEVNTNWLVRGEGSMQTITNSLFSEEDFLPDTSSKPKISESKIEAEKNDHHKNENLHNKNAENQISNELKKSGIPSDTADISESAPHRVKQRDPNDDIDKEDSDYLRHTFDSGEDVREKNFKVADILEIQGKATVSKKTRKIIFIYNDGTFSEHTPSS
jgi:transcriptional regulator with XRE-family HTH domain